MTDRYQDAASESETYSIALVLPGRFADTHDVLREIAQGSDRVTAIVGGALIEEILTRVLRSSLRPDEKQLDQAFKLSGPFSSFSAKIDMGYLTGIYGELVHKDLHCVRRIRNAFAHQLKATFRTQKVADLAKNLFLVERYSDDLNEERKPFPQPVAANVMDWPAWISLRDRDKTIGNARGRFIGELQALSWVLTEAASRRVKIGRFG